MRGLPFIAALAWALTVAPGAAAAPEPTLRFEHLSVEQGLTQESVLSIVQDTDGFMWFGTQTGLSRFDGYRFTNYRNILGDPRSLGSDWVRALHVDPKGRLWIGTDGGLNRYDPATQSFTRFLPDEPARRGNGNRHIKAIIDDGKDGLWLASGDGLQHFDIASGRFATWHHVPGDERSLIDDDVRALALDESGRLWIGTSRGLDSLAPDMVRFEHHGSGLSSKETPVEALLVDADQALWVGRLGGLERRTLHGPEAGAVRLYGPADGIARTWVKTLYQDVDRKLWVGTHDGGLYRWRIRQGRFENHRHAVSDRRSLADDYVSALYRDRVGTFWVGTWYAGVSRVDLGSGGFARIVRKDGVPDTLVDNKVLALLDDGPDRVWIATSSGLHHFDPASGKARLYRHEPDNPNSLIAVGAHALARDRRGVLWIGSRAGITSFDVARGRFTRMTLPGDADANNVRGMYTDRAGIVWITTRGGLHRLDPLTRKVRSYRHDPARHASLAHDTVRPILEDSRGRLWIGTFDGLDLLDRASGRFRHFRTDPYDINSISHDEVHYMLEDRKGDIWVGTAVGLNRMVTAPDGSVSFVRYTTREGLVDNAISAILEDADGRIWASTSSGLSCFDPASGRWRSYTAADGTIEGAYFDASALRTLDGTLYFGGFNGITAFDPRALRDNRIAPRAVITGFQIFNQPIEQAHPELLAGPIEQARSLVLPADASVFSLEFSALHFAAPQRNRFAYRLEGFDKEWVNADASKRFATYTNLDPGTYVFKVRAANKDGVWSDEPATLEITIAPPLWGTWWFRTASALLLAGVVYGAIIARVWRLRRQKELLERQVSARTEQVEHQNRVLERQTQELREQESQVRRNTYELAEANRALQENEERLRFAKQRAEDAARQKSEFLANMSHEMRTPLAGVIGMLGFALRDPALKESTREQILRGQANAQALLSIINDLLDFSKIEAGKFTIENIDFALDAAIGNVVSLFEEQAAARSLGFAVELAPDLPRFVVGDPTRLRQVLVNLVGNAFKFTNAGTVTVRVERRAADQVEGAGYNMIRFSVHDTGIGIAFDALPRLFQKFEQADTTTTRRYGGTGLGLAICRQLVELMGGTIEAASVEGVGSTFTFVLPLADGVQPPAVAHVPREPHTHRLRVLCAEDFPTNQIIVRMMLEDLGHEVDIADNGALAVQACARTRYDLVLMDGRMPEMDGATATRLIRAGGTLEAPALDQHLMIVALTANASDEDRQRYLACGMDAFLAKPIDEAALHFQLSRAIERQLQRGVALAPMPASQPDRVPSTAELDAMFGVVTGPAPPAGPVPAHGDLDGELARRLRAAFAADLPRRRAELVAALADADHEALGMLVHGLRGSAGYLGEAGLHQLCAQLEQAAGRRDWETLAAALPRLDTLLDALQGDRVNEEPLI
jgi:signal transduction histidine kinase/streptogramin lyase/DNA-binding NarL/FixJ family response regulator